MQPTAAEDDGRAALVRLVHDEGPRVLATLVRTTGSLPLAQDAVQDAVVRALESWPRTGVPAEPRAWLTLTARRRAIDLLRREALRTGKETTAMALLEGADEAQPPPSVVRDDLLRLLFTCCHPSLDLPTQTALALRTLCGLTTAEVGRALLVEEAAMAKRLTRARRKIAVARIPYRVPIDAELPDRLRGVLATVYLLFNEGYAATDGPQALRPALLESALRLARLLHEVLPDEAGVQGLLALVLLTEARRPARLDAVGAPVLLRDQDRSRWDAELIREGVALVGAGLRWTPERADPYVVQAAIAACHALSPTWDDTDWPAIISWYDVLLTVADTPVAQVNRAVALALLHGPERGLAELDRVALPGYSPQAAARAELLARAGRPAEACAAYDQALGLSMSEPVRADLVRRRDLLRGRKALACAESVHGMTDAAGLLAAYDHQLRTDAETPSALSVAGLGPLRLVTFTHGRGFVTYGDLNGADAGAVRGLVHAALQYIRDDPGIVRVEWKTRGHDVAPGLPEALVDHGFVPGEQESIMIGPVAGLAVEVPLPDGVAMRRVTAEADVRAMAAMQDEVFGDPASRESAEALLRRLALSDGMQLWVAEAAGDIVSAGRLEPVAGTGFAGIWGGATRPQWRGRGIYRALTAARARSALALGKTLIHSDSTEHSRPILERSGLVKVSTTTPYEWRR